MALFSSTSGNKLGKTLNTNFTSAGTGSVVLERHQVPTFATPFCNDAVCPVFCYFHASQLFRVISLLQNTVVDYCETFHAVKVDA